MYCHQLKVNFLLQKLYWSANSAWPRANPTTFEFTTTKPALQLAGAFFKVEKNVFETH
jgi:hypothetical protein